MADLEKLTKLLENVELLKKDSDGVIQQFDLIIKQLENVEQCESSVLLDWAKKATKALKCGALEVEVKAAETLAELCKAESPRSLLSTNETLVHLIKMLSSSSIDAQIQSCRAIGNICFDNNEGRNCVFNNGGLDEVIELLKRSTSATSKQQLRTNSAGCLLNLIMNQDQIYPKIIEKGGLELLCDLLSCNVGSEEAEETAVHVYVVLGLLADSAPGNIVMSEKLCELTVKILGSSKNGELSELCVELLHSQAENEEVGTRLAKAGLCELLLDLIEKHVCLADDDETRNLLKMACDLIIIILNGDTSMELVYQEGKGKVFEGLLSWLSSQDDDLQVSAVLAMANFARTDKHCIQMVELGVSSKLLTLLSKNNKASSKIRLEHALLSALRNLVIPAENKAKVLSQGLLAALYPMFSVPTFPVVFKLLGTLRMVIDGQSKAASELGSKSDVLKKLVEWCTTQDHPGVQGEANRLLAWIIKNSKDKEVIGGMVNSGVVGCLVSMLGAEHAVMQVEALVALNLVAALWLPRAQPHLVSASLALQVHGCLQGPPSKETFHNLLALLTQLANSSELCSHLSEGKVTKALKQCVESEHLSEYREQVGKLASRLDPG